MSAKLEDITSLPFQDVVSLYPKFRKKFEELPLEQKSAIETAWGHMFSNPRAYDDPAIAQLMAILRECHRRDYFVASPSRPRAGSKCPVITPEMALDTSNESTNSTGSRILCRHCMEADATILCEDHQMTLCEGCDQDLHRRGNTTTHKRVIIHGPPNHTFDTYLSRPSSDVSHMSRRSSEASRRSSGSKSILSDWFAGTPMAHTMVETASMSSRGTNQLSKFANVRDKDPSRPKDTLLQLASDHHSSEEQQLRSSKVVSIMSPSVGEWVEDVRVSMTDILESIPPAVDAITVPPVTQKDPLVRETFFMQLLTYPVGVVMQKYPKLKKALEEATDVRRRRFEEKWERSTECGVLDPALRSALNAFLDQGYFHHPISTKPGEQNAPVLRVTSNLGKITVTPPTPKEFSSANAEISHILSFSIDEVIDRFPKFKQCFAELPKEKQVEWRRRWGCPDEDLKIVLQKCVDNNMFVQ
eukprot:PhF_6_TR10852/c1_g1_i4/m.17567